MNQVDTDVEFTSNIIYKNNISNENSFVNKIVNKISTLIR